MIFFRVSRVGGGAPSGFDLGDLEIDIDETSVSSKENQKFRMMIYLSIISLIDGLLSIKNGGAFEFVATDSSFSFTLRHSKEILLLQYRGRKIAISSYRLLAESIQQGVDKFLSEANKLAPNDSVHDDFSSSLHSLESYLKIKK